MSYTQAEKLQILLLCDIHKALNIENSYDPDFISAAIESDNLWSIGWEYQSLSTDEDTPEDVKHVCDVLDMYGLLKFTYDHLSPQDQIRLAEDIPTFSVEHDLVFPGFDGNNESNLMSIARIFSKMGRFNTQDLTKNSHRPTFNISERMLEVFLPQRSNFHHQRGLTYDALRDTLLASIHPSNR
ncbi:YfbU family protein [Erwinia amylovora]|uniref:YfbU family protein n=1 Tax=Erwinia amylovora TaxID=552 RepID=UPI0014441817|nr:YfbU family protein [Erwinia amylovora]